MHLDLAKLALLLDRHHAVNDGRAVTRLCHCGWRTTGEFDHATHVAAQIDACVKSGTILQADPFNQGALIR